MPEIRAIMKYEILTILNSTSILTVSCYIASASGNSKVKLCALGWEMKMTKKF